jgi:hypothetical protein
MLTDCEYYSLSGNHIRVGLPNRQTNRTTFVYYKYDDPHIFFKKLKVLES